MVQYETYKQFSDRTGISLSSVYRAARKGNLKTTRIKGVSHIIIEDEDNYTKENFFNELNSDKIDNVRQEKNDKHDKIYQDAEIIDESPGLRYEIDIFKNSINTIEEMSTRIEAAKDEVISALKDNIEKQQTIIDNQEKNIDNLNSVIKTLSSDNQELRTSLAVRDAEKNIANKKLDEVDKIISDKDKQIDKLNDKIFELEEKITKYNNKPSLWEKINKQNRL